jgi:3-hydroxyacyl-CoA dehydrogenase
MTASYHVQANVAVITLNNPPVNGLGLATRQAVVQGVLQANQDPAVEAVVITGAGKAFSGGADIREFGTPKATAEPHLLSLIATLEASQKPIVAALHSVAMGGGVELALACHYRLAAPGTKVALPEVKLGLIPGSGGTQRMPRALGVEAALNLMVKGDPVAAEALAQVPGQKLFSRIAASAETLMDEALALAHEVAQVRPLPLLRHLSCAHPQGDGYFQFARNTVRAVAPQYPAPLKCIDMVQQATKLPFEDAMRQERDTFLGLMGTPESRALRHAFFAERQTSKIPDVAPDTPTRPIKKVGVIGAGTMGGGIAMNFLNAGIAVVMLETSDEALQRGVGVMRKNYEARVKKGKLKPEKLEQLWGLLHTTLNMDDLADADLIIEAVFEDMQVKRQVFERLDAVAKPGAILASNTSTLDLNQIARFTKRPQDVVGMHFFSPANVMRLLEVVRGEQTAPDVLASVMRLAKTIRKTAVVSGVCDGFIGNRMVEQYIRQALFMLDEGATPQQIDRAIEKFGFAMGPFRMSDLAGNDIGWAIRKRRYQEQPALRYGRTADLLCEQGRFGQKVGKGWYDYPAGSRKAVPSAEVEAMIAAHRQSLDLEPRRLGNEEIVQRLVFALVNEGARILEEKIAIRASDIDMVYLTGYGFPLWRGGPMCYADTVGLLPVTYAMQRFAQNPNDDAEFWQPAPLLAELAAAGKPFNA